MANNSKSAFPVMPPLGGSSSGYPWPDQGMSLRDYFAGEMLRGIIVSIDETDLSKIVAFAYKMADAMLAERSKEAT